MNLLRIYLAFAGAYFLSYLLRMVNAVISPDLTRDLGLSASALGLLTSAYPIAFMAMQLPLGILIDRYGPRNVEGSLLAIAALGALLFGLADSASGLLVARALIGVGVSACLMAALNGFQRWYPVEKRPAMTGWIMVAAGLGGIFATTPVEWGLSVVGWRAVFYVLAALACLASVAIWLLVPATARGAEGEPLRDQAAGVVEVVATARFLRIAPIMGVNMGAFMAIQGLWSVPWMMEVDGLGRSGAALVLLAMGVVMLACYVLLGVFTEGLARRGIGHGLLFGVGMALSLLAYAAIALRVPMPPLVAWSLYGGGITVSSFSFNLLAQSVPLARVGRVTTALNLIIFLGHVLAQWGVGVAVDAGMALGRTKPEALQTAFVALLGLQAAAYAWFALAWKELVRTPGVVATR
jgi:predicted MFS family arabinose efflux permease